VLLENNRFHLPLEDFLVRKPVKIVAAKSEHHSQGRLT
jgi:hypothetical protein